MTARAADPATLFRRGGRTMADAQNAAADFIKWRNDRPETDKPKPISADEVRAEMRVYVDAYGMEAAKTDLPAVWTCNGVHARCVSEIIPYQRQKAIDAVRKAVVANPFGRERLSA